MFNGNRALNKALLTRPLSSFKLKIVRKTFGSYSGSNMAVIRFLIFTLSTAWLKRCEKILYYYIKKETNKNAITL